MADPRTVIMGGKPRKLLGNVLKVGDRVPEAELIALDLQPRKLSEFRGKVCIFSAVPSLDTSVCDKETRRFNEMAAALGKDVAVVTISVDLPFAQKRWCNAAQADEVVLLSDHRDLAFGEKFGVVMEGTRQLARAVFVADREGVVRHIQIVDQVAHEPNYEEILSIVKSLL